MGIGAAADGVEFYYLRKLNPCATEYIQSLNILGGVFINQNFPGPLIYKGNRCR
jgi:hypothetical protein